MSNFKPRLTKNGIWQDPKWYSGNPFDNAGYGLPNCTCYAYGRFWEVNGEKPRSGFPLGNADSWFPAVKASGLYRTGSIAKPGAIICFTTAGTGHVAVVEQIKPNGNFIVSQSAYTRPVSSYPPDMSNYWYLSEISGKTNEPVDHNRYKFQGFIYPSADFSHRFWYDSNKDLTVSEMKHNAGNVVDILRSAGWTDNAIAGILANMETESQVNPGRWQNGVGPGFGLVQWDPAEKYLNWARTYFGSSFKENSGEQQLVRIRKEMNGEFGQYLKTDMYPLTGPQFIASTADAGYLAKTFMINYERPGDQSTANQERRAAIGRKWFEWISGYTPGPGPGPSGNLPVWLLVRIKKMRR